MKKLALMKKHIFWLLLICFLPGCGNSTTDIVYEDFLTDENQDEVESIGSDFTENEELNNSTLFVHICGAVMQSGVYELQENDRICDAVDAAGGFHPEADYSFLNLAKKLTDGEQIYIPTKEEVEKMNVDGITGMPVSAQESFPLQNDTESVNTKININTATIEELCTLSGIGESRAKSIIEFREKEGLFVSIEDIMKVPGIKNAAFEKMKDEICVQ